MQLGVVKEVGVRFTTTIPTRGRRTTLACLGLATTIVKLEGGQGLNLFISPTFPVPHPLPCQRRWCFPIFRNG